MLYKTALHFLLLVPSAILNGLGTFSVLQEGVSSLDNLAPFMVSS